jgi:DNA-binding response OmpR family regulator
MNPQIDVLLEDDNQANVQLTLRAIAPKLPPNRVNVARDAEEAVDGILRSASDSSSITAEIDFVGFELPKISGFDVLLRLKNDLRAKVIPVVVLSSSKQEKDVLKSYDLGANSYLQKPVDFDEFRDVIRRVARYWLQLNQAPFLQQ